MKNLIGFILIIFSLILFSGCEKYQEGEQAATEIFEKMTVLEKGLYNAVESNWDAGFLYNVRLAVNNREAKPLENNIPFIDIANVIKSNNDVTLKINDQWRTEAKNEAINGRWDRIDDNWYKKIINKLGLKESDIVKEPLFYKPIVVEDKSLDKIIAEHDAIVIQPQPLDINSIKNIISKEDYDDLFYEIKGCESAIDYYNKTIKDRLLTIEDKDILIQLSIKCKAIQIGEKLSQ